ncbi:MAG: hypothetical protein AB8B80_15635 [Marinicellaceae bacterium]
MDISIKQIRIGYRLGVYDYDDVQNWVNFQVLQKDEINNELLDLSFTKRNDNHEIYSLLCTIPGSSEDDESLISALGDLKDVELNNLKFCCKLAEKLYAYYVDKDYEVDEKLNEISFLDDAYDLALQGIGDTVESWHARFREFIYELRSC